MRLKEAGKNEVFELTLKVPRKGFTFFGVSVENLFFIALTLI